MKPNELQKLLEASLKQVIEKRGISEAQLDTLLGELQDTIPEISRRSKK